MSAMNVRSRIKHAEDDHVGAAGTHEQARERAADQHRADRADDHAEAELYGGSPRDQPDHLPQLRAERDPNSDLLRALNDGIRGDGIEADHRQHQGKRRKHHEHSAEDAIVPALLRKHFVERHHVEERQIPIEAAQMLANPCHDALGLDAAANHQRDREWRLGSAGNIDNGIRLRFVDVTLAHGPRHAHHCISLERSGPVVVVAQPDRLTDRIDVG